MIGYYVHHHGDGHRQRGIAIACALGDGITLLGTGLAGRTGGIACIDLPDDRRDGADFDGCDATQRPDALHYAPIDHDGIRRRVALITAWIAEARPSLIVVDVSAEIAMLARLASVPTVYVRLSGRRADPAHLDAFRGATALLAPFHEQLDDERTAPSIKAKSFFAPGIIDATTSARVESDVVLGVVGLGGAPSDGERWAEAARTVPDMRWRVIGPCTAPSFLPPNLELRGWVDDADTMIARAAVVVGGAGDGVVGSVLANRRPFLCIPEPRPFDEQRSKADRLAELGAAVVVPDWPAAEAWPALIARTRSLDPTIIGGLGAHGGARRVANWLRDMVEGHHRIGGRTA